MATYTIHADAVDSDLQNAQDWARTWGEIQNEIRRFDGEVIDAYAVLGDYDFRFTFEAPDEAAAVRIAVALESYGLDTRTHQLIDAERFGAIVEDL